ncbi:MAG: hypothetical protein ABIY52_05785 [Gemmatimonadaceae bacterium]
MSIVLHPAPSTRAILAEQLRLTGLRARLAGIVFACVLCVIAAGALRMAWMTHEACQQYQACAKVNFTFSPQVSILLSGLALLYPLIIWQDEDPSHRLYFSAMPVSRTRHVFLRVLGGWLWLMLTVALFLIGMVLVKAIAERMTGAPQRYDAGFTWWEWLVPFTATTVAYALASAATVATQRPFVWIFGLPLLYASMVSLLHELYVGPSRDIARAMTSVGNGTYGAMAAMAGVVERVVDGSPTITLPSFSRWTGASALWLVVGLALLYAVAQRRAEGATQ